MYNVELRRNPTLRGRLVLRITIEPGGEVSACQVQSNELASPELVAQIVERVKEDQFRTGRRKSPRPASYIRSFSCPEPRIEYPANAAGI